VPYPAGRAPSQRFRIEQWLPRFLAEGIECDVLPFFDGELYRRLEAGENRLTSMLGLCKSVARRWRLLSRIDDYDIVIIHREATAFGPAWLERMIARRKPIVFDLDDAIWLSNENRVNPAARWLKFPSKAAGMARRAAAVLAGNPYLADWARRYNAAVHVIPTTVDTEGEYAAEKVHSPHDVPVIGWSGSVSSLRYLEFLRPILVKLAASHRYKLLVMCNGPEHRWAGLDMEWLPWSQAGEIDGLLRMDIGLMPQPDEEWAKGKCGLKALQYMALGIPTVASNNGVLPEIIRHGHSGLLADSPEQWLKCLTMLVDDWTLRVSIGRSGRQTVRERYSSAMHAPRVVAALRAAAKPQLQVAAAVISAGDRT
jgi:glycosyltransferase involved in cell wall biosynthesis